MSAGAGREPFRWYAGFAAAAAVAGLAVAAWAPSSAEARLGALVGSGAAALSGALALPLKRWAVARSLKAALVAMVSVFGFRMVLVAAGLAVVLAKDAGAMAFTLGFFGVYLVLQWLEISYVVAERKRLGPGAS